MRLVNHRPFLLSMAALTLVPWLTAPVCFGWGTEGHRMINRLAAEHLPADVPDFLYSAAALKEIEYLGPEPDRWRSTAEPELSSAQGPEHFIDLELADRIGPLPRNRFDYIAALYAAAAAHPEWAKDLRPEHVGLQPYITIEVYERLQAAFREYRAETAQHNNTKPVEDAVLFYTGWLGHYVGDGSQPLHVTVNYDGWASHDNPHDYSAHHGIHLAFEGPFVATNLHPADIEPRMTATHILGDPFEDYLSYLRHSATLVERVYQLDRSRGYIGKGNAEARDFAAERLAAGASELRDLIYTAWVDSARPVPEWRPRPEPPKTEGAGSSTQPAKP